MKTPLAGMLTLLLALSTALGADEPLKKPADNPIYAQKLVNEIAAHNPDIILLGFHAIAPGSTKERMIACTHDLIGEEDDAGDLAVVAAQQTVLAVNLAQPTKYRVYLPLKDAAGGSIGLITLNFKNESKFDEVHYCSRAVKIRNDAAKSIPNLAALMAPR